MPVFQDLDAWIEVGSERVAEYDVTIDEKADEIPSVLCWIPSTTGKSFSVHWIDHSLPRPAMKATLHADGVHVRNAILLASYGPHMDPSNNGTIKFISTPDGRREMEFCDIQFTDDDSSLDSSNHVSLGEITLQLTPTIVISRNERGTRTSVRLHEGKVHEQSKKAVAHAVRAGNLTDVPESTTLRNQVLGLPLVKFTFRYRPLALLQANGIAPPPAPAPFSLSPSPPSIRHAHSPDVWIKSEDDNKSESGLESSDEKIRCLQAEIDRIRNRKRRRSSTVTIKSEPSSQRIKFSGKHEVIDLTLDD